MHQVFAIFLRDVKRILKNPVALVVTLGVAIIPSLYAWCNILANWDPYANTGNIQVAVANEDKGTTSTLVGHLDAGQQTVNQLKKNHQLGWRFVPEQQAIEGVESGKYYAAIVLPEDFSSRLIGTVTGKGDRPSITYYINEKLNAIAPKITDTGATTIDEQINTTFVSSVADAVAKEVKEAAGETTGSMKSAQSDVINDLTDTINQLETVQQQLRGTRSTLDKALTTIDSAKQSNIALASGITNSLDTVGKASDLLSETRTQTERFSNTLVGALDNGSTQLSGLQVNVSNATGTVLSGLNTTQDALDQVSSTMHHVNTTTGNVLDGVEKVKLFGEEIAVKAKIVNFQGLSSHADHDHLVQWIKAFDPKPTHVFVVHGDEDVAPVFAEELNSLGFHAHAAKFTECYDLAANEMVSEGYISERKRTAQKSRADNLYAKLVAAAESLLEFAKRCKGRPNKDISALTGQIISLIERFRE